MAKWPEDYTNCYSQRDLDAALSAERARVIAECAKIADEFDATRLHLMTFPSAEAKDYYAGGVNDASDAIAAVLRALGQQDSGQTGDPS